MSLLTAGVLFDLFLSSTDSNTRELEEAALMHWVHYTHDEVFFVNICIIICTWIHYNGILKIINPKDQERQAFQISLWSIMVFATGMGEEPPMEFDPSISQWSFVSQGKYL